MKDKNIWMIAGIIIYIFLSGIDRFVYRIPNIAIFGMFLIFAGVFKKKN